MDHRCWERPEDMDTPRNVYKVSAQNPGSDVASETAAALAASSLVFKDSDPTYSSQLLQAAINVRSVPRLFTISIYFSLSNCLFCQFSWSN
jgi:hypothetical protein